MDLRHELAHALLGHHPSEAAAVLERLEPDSAASTLAAAEPEVAAAVLRRSAPTVAVALLEALPRPVACAAVAHIDIDAGAALLRRLASDVREEILAGLPEEAAQPLGAMLGFPEESAGAWMDPQVLSLPARLRVDEAIALIRRSPDHARYNVYVTDDEQRLVGVLNLRELLLANPEASLESEMTSSVASIRASADRHSIVAHPGWRSVHSLPVVDADRRYLGALRYRTLRRLEEQIRGDATNGHDTTRQALGDLFSTGLGGVVETLASGLGRP